MIRRQTDWSLMGFPHWEPTFRKGTLFTGVVWAAAADMYEYMYSVITFYMFFGCVHACTCTWVCCVALPCLFDLACFFLPYFSHLSLKHVHVVEIYYDCVHLHGVQGCTLLFVHACRCGGAQMFADE